MKLFISIWLICGAYGVFANMERIPRVYGRESWADLIQHIPTLLLGPIGVWFVMAGGGRFAFWRKHP